MSDPTGNNVDKAKEALQGTTTKSGWFGKDKHNCTPVHEVIDRIQAPPQRIDAQSIANQLELQLSHLILDVMMPINIKPNSDNATLFERDFHATVNGNGVYDAKDEWVYQHAINLSKVLLHYFLHEQTYYCKVQLGEIMLIAQGKPVQNGDNFSLELAGQGGHTIKVPVLKAVVIRGIGSAALRDELTALFTLRAQLLRGLRTIANLSHKAVVSVEGLTAAMAEASKDEKLLNAVQKELGAQAISLFDSQNDIALLDANTKISGFKLELSQLSEQLEFIYSELARILQIPKTKLLGEAPGGLNATGAYDYRNYQDLLEGIRSSVVYPFVEHMQINYEMRHLYDSTQILQGVQTLMLAEQNLSGLTLDGMRELYQKILGSLGNKLVSDDNINIVPYVAPEPTKSYW